MKSVDFEEHLTEASPRLIFAFASQDRFEWGSTLTKARTSFVLFRDPGRRWWQDGVAGIGDQGAVVRYMQKTTERYEHAFTLGLSMGAYGALMYGALTNIDTILAISPVTGKGEHVHRDIPKELHHRVEHRPGDVEFMDLRPLFTIPRRTETFIWVSDGHGTEVDLAMARRIHGAQIIEVPGHSHAELGAFLAPTIQEMLQW
jgi:sirohydrochlorin ferrochelatase